MRTGIASCKFAPLRIRWRRPTCRREGRARSLQVRRYLPPGALLHPDDLEPSAADEPARGEGLLPARHGRAEAAVRARAGGNGRVNFALTRGAAPFPKGTQHEHGRCHQASKRHHLAEVGGHTRQQGPLGER